MLAQVDSLAVESDAGLAAKVRAARIWREMGVRHCGTFRLGQSQCLRCRTAGWKVIATRESAIGCKSRDNKAATELFLQGSAELDALALSLPWLPGGIEPVSCCALTVEDERGCVKCQHPNAPRRFILAVVIVISWHRLTVNCDLCSQCLETDPISARITGARKPVFIFND